MLPTGPRKALRRVREWLEEQCGHLWLGCVPGEDREHGFLAELYPCIGHLQVEAPARGIVRLRAETDPVGPGFHVWLTKLARAMGIDLKLRWEDPLERPDDVFGDDADESEIEMAMLRVARQLWEGAKSAGEGVAAPHGPQPATAATPSEDELRRLFPWWARGHDARYYLNRALTLMWSELTWRAPESAEAHLRIEHAHQMLLMARSRDPSLALPWPEWREMLAHLQVEGSITVEVGRAAEECGRPPAIGYLRGQPPFE